MRLFNRMARVALSVTAAVIGAVGLAGCGGDDGASGGGGVKTVDIGGVKWMAANLNVSTSNSWCYDNSSSNCSKYGRLYTWNAARSACPSGFHLPSRSEWQGLIASAGSLGVGKSGAGYVLKATSGWENSGNGNNATGFSAMPGGEYDGGSFYGGGYQGFWWSNHDYGDGDGYVVGVRSDGDGADEYSRDKDRGYSVRCVKD